MKRQRIPLIGSSINRNDAALSFITSDQRFENCYPEITRNPLSGVATAYCVKRNGFDTADVAGASYVGLSGSCVWSGYSSGARGVFAYLNGTTLAVWDTSTTIVGATIANISGAPRLNETSLTGVSNLTLVATKSTDSLPHAWFIAEGGGGWTEIVDADYPANQATPLTTVGNMIHMDGYAFIMDSRGQIWNSDLNSLVNWTSTSFVTAQSSPDTGSGLEKSRNVIIGFGAKSVDFFQNAGNATGSPLTRVTGVSAAIGCLPKGLNNCETHKSIGDYVFFVGVAGDTGAWGVYQILGTSITKISTPAIDKTLAQGADNGNHRGIAGGMVLGGMQHVVLYTGYASDQPVYCIETKTWWYIKTSGPEVIETCCGINGKSYFSTSTNTSSQGRKLFTCSPSVTNYTDNSAAYTMSVQTLPLDQGTSRKKIYTYAELLCDHQSSAGVNISISWSDDDYQTFSTARTIDPASGTRRITRLGATQRNYNNRRAWKITDSGGRPFRGEALEVFYVEGPS